MIHNKYLEKDNINLNDLSDVNGISVSNSIVYNSCLNLFGKKDYEDSSKRPLAAAVLGLDNTDIPIPDQLDYYTGWTDGDAQESYLQSKPKTFLILGKQGTGSYNLGEALSKKLNCFHLCPKNVLLDEIEQNSPVGKCLDFNMRHNKVCKSDIVLGLMKKKLESPSIKHRGFIISGLPLITTNKNKQYFIESLYAEESLSVADEFLCDLMSTLKKKKPEAKKSSAHSSVSTVDEELDEIEIEEQQEQEQDNEEIEETIVELPKFMLDSCSDHIISFKAYYTTKEILLLQQIQELFNFKPDIVILTSSPNLDTVVKRRRKFLNYSNNLSYLLAFTTNFDTEIRWPPRYSMIDYVKPIDNHSFNPKYYCKQPLNFEKNCMAQICNYKDIVAPIIEQKLKDFSPNTLIKLDGRTTTHQMLNNLMERFLLMPIKPVLIPEPLYMEDPPEDLEDFWRMVEELNVIRSGVISFNRYASLWYNRCPVELFKRRSTQGNAKYAVIFFKHVYLLSTLNAMVSFCRNPRPYLQLNYLEPTCRMIVLGTKSSGKTMIANCLSWLFTAPIICFNTLLKSEKQKKYDNYSKTILSEIITTIEDNRFTEWQNIELQRISNLNTWYNTVTSALSTYIPLLIKVTTDNTYTTENPVGIKRFGALRDRLSFLPVDDLFECQTVLKDKNALLNYAPRDLLVETSKPKIPNLGDEDVTQAIEAYIVANDLQKDIELTVEEIMKEIIQNIKNIDTISFNNTPDQTYGKFIIDGFPSEPEYWSFLVEFELLPDYTIGLIENREIDADLIHHYKTIEKFTKNHQERFLLSNDVLIKTKLLHGKPADNIYLDIQILLENMIRDIIDIIVEDDDKEQVPDTNAITNFTEAIEKIREGWDISKLKLQENFKCFVEIEIENQNDIEVLDEVLLKIRKCYFKPCVNLEDGLEDQEDDNEITKDALTYNEPRFLGETNIYCPMAFYEHGVLWEGKSGLATSYDNKLYFFSKEECSDFFQHDITKYISYNKPYKQNIPLRICVVGGIGSGKTSCSKLIAKELGLTHVDFEDFVNNTLIPKHFKKVGWQYENSFTDASMDEEEIVELQIDEENLNYVSDIVYNEQEIRRMIYNYFERGSPLLSVLLQSLIKKLWNEKPFNDKGVVIDGFPKLPTDIDDMISCFCIPNIVIELESNSETSIDRVYPKMFKMWKMQLNEAKLKAKNKLDLKRWEWQNFITRTVVIKVIIDEILENSVILETAEETLQTSSLESTIFDAHPSGLANIDANLFTAYHELIQEHPEPTDQNVWDNADDMLEKIKNRLESIFDIEDENVQALKDILYEQKIKTVSIDGKKEFNKVTRKLLMALSTLRNKSSSFLEQTFIVSCDVAEILLMEGFFFVSKFYRMCPVYISENPETKLNPYTLNKHKNMVFPIVHRSYIYFISSEERVRKFRRDPLKYINDDQIKSYKEHPLRIGIIGPPKSGKSKLAAKLAKRYGLISISRGMAIRHVLENMHWTALGSTMLSLLNEGKCIDNDLIMKAVLTVAFDHRTMTNGFILDGFPDTPFEICELLKYGLYPLIMFDIQSDQEQILKNSQYEVYLDILKVKPPLSRPFIKNRYDKWFEKCSAVRDWINLDTQNLHTINGNNSQWRCVVDACSKIEEINKDVHYFLTHAKSKVVSTNIMCISNEMFEQKMSCYKNLCPICFHKNILRHSGYPADKKGVILYNNQLFWICPEHLKFVLNSPEKHLCRKTIDIPEIPAVITNITTSLIYENGICIVTYAENLPSQNLVRGKSTYAVIYHKNIYLLCSSKCMAKFLSKPYMYYNIKVFRNTNIFPKLTLNKLPNLGYLEQTVGNILTDACCSVNVSRPKYPGLDTSISAILHIALYLKIHNDKIDESTLPIYLKTFKKYESRCKLVTDIGLRLRSIDNPFASYPKCCGRNRVDKSDSDTVRKPPSFVSSNTSRVPVPDERYDYLCQYHKPASKVPAFLNVVDIAGLVKGAAEGQGLGNAFLSHIKACDAIFNLCRAFDDESVIHVDGEVNPVRDLETIGEELRLKDEEQLIQHVEKLDRAVNRGGDKKLKPEYEALAKVKTILVEEKKHIRFGDWSAADIEVLNKYLFLTSKPALYLVNLSEKDYIRKKNKWLPKLKEWIDKNDPGAPLIPFSGALESKLLDMEPDEREKFLKESNITSALDKIIVQGYKALQLEYFFTAGADEVKAWTIQKGTKAPQAAGRIHTDFEKGFIMAEVMHYKDFKEEGSESACKSAGKYRQQGRNYVVDDGDIIFFKFNAGAGLKDAKKK